MPIATMTSKGQITIPKEIRDALRLRPGDRIDFQREKDGRVVLRPATRSILDLAGIVKWKGPPVSIDEMDEAIGRALAERFRRSGS